ncbi:MAG: hypothetical protein GX660_15395 [Clostridiaceae bacterium]|nr:hypothetical protein [Clostridiaceae bacterium]
MVEKEKELSLYLEEWITARYSDWNMFYHSTNQNKRNGIYLLKSGARLMDLLDDIMGNIEEHFAIDANSHIIPSRFSSIPQLLQFLDNFQKHIKKQFHLIEKNIVSEETDSIVIEMYKMCSDIDQMVTRCLSIYQADEDIPIPYQQARMALRNNDVKLFVELIGSLIKNVPYSMHKEKVDEGYFHTIIHVITAVLGMSPVSEAEISDGRIDMMMEYPTRIFIMEFKYEANGKDRSIEALQQIKDNRYAEAYYIKGKVIEGVGISFSKETRNVSAFVTERLYTPQVYPFMKG